MPVDLVTIGFGADTSDLAQAATSLDKVSAAADRTQKAVDGLADEFVDAGQKVQQSVGAATAAAERDLKRSAVQFRSLQEQINQGLRIGQGAGGSASASAKAIEELTTLREKYVPLAKAQRDYGDAQAEIADAAKRGAISETERVAALNAAAAAFQRQTGVVKEAGGAAKLTAAQMQQLGFQVNDLATQIASGASPFQAIAQQGGQIYQALGMGPNGAGGSLRAIGDIIKSVITPGRLAFAGLAAGVLGFAAALNSALANQRELEMGLGTGLGRAAGVTVEQFKAISRAAADAAGVSRSSAEALALEFAKTGKIGGEMFGQLILFARRFAETTGQTFEDAGKEVAKFFSDPAKGLEMMQDRLGALDGSERALIKSLITANDKIGAQQALLAAFSRGNAVAAATKEIRTLGDVWDALAVKASNAANATVNAVRRMVAPDKGELLAGAEAARNEMDLFDPSTLTRAGQRKAAEWQAQKDALDAYILSLKDAIEAERQQSEIQGTRNAAREADTLAAAYTPALEQVRQLQEAQNKLRDAYNEGLPVEDLARVADAYRRVTEQLRAFGEARSSLAIAANQAITALNDESAATERLNAMVSAGILTQQQAQGQMANAQQLAKLASEAAQAEMRGEYELAGELNRAYTQLTQAIERSGQAKAAAQAQSMVQSLKDEIEILRLKISMHGEEANAIERVVAARQVEQQIRNMGLAADSEQANQLRRSSEEALNLRQRLDELNRTSENGADSAKRLGEAWKSAASSIQQTAMAAVGAGSALQTAFAGAFAGGGGAQTGSFSIYSTNYANEVANYGAWQKQAQAENAAAQSELQRTISMLERNIQNMQGRWENYQPDAYAEKNPLVFYDVNRGTRYTEAERAQITALESQLATQQKQLAELQRIAQLLQMPAGQALRDPLTFRTDRNLGPSIFDDYVNGYGALVNKDLVGIYPGFAEGGSMMLGGKPGRDNNVLSLNGSAIARVSKGERLDVLTPRQQAANNNAASSPVMQDNRQFHINIKREGPPPSTHRQWEDERMADERFARRLNSTLRGLAK